MKYMGIGYFDVVSSPSWVLQLISLRMSEEAEKAEKDRRKSDAQNRSLKSKYGR